MQHEIDDQKHHNNLLKTVEGTAWILCDALKTMAHYNIVPDEDASERAENKLAQHLAEIFEIISECEEPNVIDYTADKMLQFANNEQNQLIAYVEKYMGDNPLGERIVHRKYES
ncbi:hypothetical protein HNQ80_000079 [Anaerosolibacter carboniphilus]|uniref:Uncharacterized protein n=1 Tax=Anaerosolibacter carboniphilus TaxID=1417629 RepID=A0A841KPI5_9FIRM|nr:hypothetical protein [Anaerosolibacter carboniphilus]MBB6214010.1 hypothetical protein [Anaerosolibacter carboniphilus]